MAKPSTTDFGSQTDISGTVVSSSELTAANTVTKFFFDKGYLKTFPALLKIAEAVLCLLGLICVHTIYNATQNSAGGWYYFVSMTGFWITLLFLASYTYHVVERFQKLPWLAAEMGYATLWVIFFFIAAIVAATRGNQDPAWSAAAVIGFVAMLVFAYEAFQKYGKWHRGEVPQGKGQSTIVDPNYAANESAD